MGKSRTEHDIQNTYRSSLSDVMLGVGLVLLLVVPLAWASLKPLFA
jgi:hypothetical protein